MPIGDFSVPVSALKQQLDSYEKSARLKVIQKAELIRKALDDFSNPKPTTVEKEELHTKFENLVIGDKKKNIIVTNDHNNREPTGGFTYKKNFDIEGERPHQPEPTVFQSAVCLAFDTRWDCQLTSPTQLSWSAFPYYITPGPKNATWLYNNFQDIPVSEWESKNPEFKSRIQQILDLTVICCAKAINFVADYWVNSGKECSECTDDSNPDPGQTTLKKHISWLAVAVSIIIFIGVASAIGIPVTEVLAYYVAKPKTV